MIRILLKLSIASCLFTYAGFRKKIWNVFGPLYMLAHIAFAHGEASTFEYMRHFQVAWLLHSNVYNSQGWKDMIMCLSQVALFALCRNKFVLYPLIIMRNIASISKDI